RKYVDREKGDRVALLDQYLQFNGSDTLSPFLTEMVVKWAVKGPSYRDARDRFYDLLGYQAMSQDRKSTRLNSSHVSISYAVFCYGDHRDLNSFPTRRSSDLRKYVDRETGDRVALLDQYLQFNGSDTLSPFLTEMVVKWAVKGPSYRDARDRFYDLLGYQAMS